MYTKTCFCGRQYHWEPDQERPYPPSACPECLAKKKEENRLRNIRENIETAEGMTSPRMRQTSVEHPSFNRNLWKRVRAWKPTDEKPWLGLVGETGSCKTRIALLILRKWATEFADQQRAFRPMLIDGPRFGRIVLEQFSDRRVEVPVCQGSAIRSAPDEGAVGYLSGLRRADILIFDELGKVRNTPAVIGEWFALIDHRHNHNLVTVWTSNTRPEAFCAGLPGEHAEPICGRILETSTIVEA